MHCTKREYSTAYGPKLKRILTCNDEDKDCWLKTCTKCSPKSVEENLRVLLKGNEKKVVKWWLWDKDQTTNRTEKRQTTGTLKKLLDFFISVYRPFLVHSFTNRQQSKSFREDEEYVDVHNDECQVLCDFAENFTNVSQDEVTNAHWNQKQVCEFHIAVSDSDSDQRRSDGFF